MKHPVNIFWFRRDLRLHDNAALYHALKSSRPVLPIFIFDTNILDELEEDDARVQFIHQEVEQIHLELKKKGSGVQVFHSTPEQAFKSLLDEFDIEQVFANTDYEQYARDRDEQIAKLLLSKGATFSTYKDQVVFDKSEVVKGDGEPYVVYTPYSRRWKEIVNDFYLEEYPIEKYISNVYAGVLKPMPALQQMGFRSVDIEYPKRELLDEEIRHYDRVRDFPAQEGTTRIGIHLRFGTISIRALVKQAMRTNQVYLNELIWREFYMMILWNYPHVGQGKAFRPEYDRIAWRNNEDEFSKWCEGKTGYPLVDAGMRQLNSMGYMHNRVRMVTASFLSKHLLIDWRWGEAYFASKLLDYEFSSNNGGWQWAAGSGCDAAPYFRIFNPTLQAKKFDPKGEYIRKWVPELESFDYPSPLVEHDFARKRCLEVYGRAVRT
jgi:deoxyribodipyrimidine photo-lyase